MKVALPLLALVCAMVQTAFGQITVDCVFDQKAFLVGEDIAAKVKVSNFSGRVLTLGEKPDWIRLSVTPADGGIAPQRVKADFSGDFQLPNAKVATKHINIARYHELKPGRYTVVAQVVVPGFGEVFQSGPRVFDVVSGTTVWETVFGVPNAEGGDSTRRYVLQKGHLGKNMKLYLRLTDGSGMQTYRVFPLAGMVSFSSPETQVDEQSRLHVLHQYGARAFNYSVISPDGEMVRQERHDLVGSRPTLRMNSAGEIIVVGGVKKAIVLDRDAPTSPPEEPTPSETKTDDKPASE